MSSGRAAFEAGPLCWSPGHVISMTVGAAWGPQALGFHWGPRPLTSDRMRRARAGLGIGLGITPKGPQNTQQLGLGCSLGESKALGLILSVHVGAHTRLVIKITNDVVVRTCNLSYLGG